MENNNEDGIKNALKQDLNSSFGVSQPSDLQRLKDMTTNPDKSGEFYMKNPNDFSGTVNSKLGIKILIGAVIIFAVGILGYTFFFY